MSGNPGPKKDYETLVRYKCKACGEWYDEEDDAEKCFRRHTRNIGEMVTKAMVHPPPVQWSGGSDDE